MIDLGKYMYAKVIDQKPKSVVIGVYSQSSNVLLGKVKWYGPWRQYCFYPEPDTIFNTECLGEIATLLKTAQRFSVEIKKRKGS